MAEEIEQKAGLAIIVFASQQHFLLWLEANGESSPGIWMKIGKKSNPAPSITYSEGVEAGLIWGWIDGQKGSYDADWYLQRFTPRRSKSMWSKVNVDRIEGLIIAGRMQPPGMAAVEAAKADGRWDRAYASQSVIEVPPDLAKALKANSAARKAFEALTGSRRYAVLYRIETAKLAETRKRRITQFVDMLASGEIIKLFTPTKKAD